MKNKYIRWLYEELPKLIDKGVLSSESAEKIRKYYGEVPERSGRKIALIVFSILGTILISGGIILLLAHNWKDLSRFTRTILSLLPLLIGHGLGIWFLSTGRTSVAWREGISTFLTFAVCSAISLISQTYHIPGDMGAFLLTWMLLSIPLVYLFNASLPCIIYFVGITFWAGYEQEVGGQALLFWPLLGLTIPHIYSAVKKNAYSGRSSLMGWTLSLCLCVATGITLEKAVPGLWIIVYSALFSVMYLVGSYWFGQTHSVFQQPYQGVGASGVVILSLLLTYEFPWDDIGWGYYRSGFCYHPYAAWADYLLVLILFAAAVYLLVISFRRKEKRRILFGIMPVIALFGYTLSAFSNQEIVPRLLFNLYMFSMGLGALVLGIRTLDMGTVNGGMIILAILILARFFDVELTFVERGLGFILVGAGFLVTNIILVKKAKKGGG
ncbi:MAG: DUF2157 domain-containing protein [Candidatus Aureabacteria bacterium]|nr:DUF2157 domain-containing protein [Candidatus Auribacterota bacterium]